MDKDREQRREKERERSVSFEVSSRTPEDLFSRKIRLNGEGTRSPSLHASCYPRSYKIASVWSEMSSIRSIRSTVKVNITENTTKKKSKWNIKQKRKIDVNSGNSESL